MSHSVMKGLTDSQRMVLDLALSHSVMKGLTDSMYGAGL